MLPASFLALLLVLGTTSATEYLIRPTDGPPCFAGYCGDLTLDELARNTSQYAMNNVIIVLLPGEHNLTNPMVVTSSENVTLIGHFSSDGVRPTIACYSSTVSDVSFKFVSVSGLAIEGLTFSGCAPLVFNQTINASLQSLLIEHASSDGILVMNTLGDFVVENCRFFQNYDFDMRTLLSHVPKTFQNDLQASGGSRIRVSNCSFHLGWSIHFLLASPNYAVDLVVENVVMAGMTSEIELLSEYLVVITIRDSISVGASAQLFFSDADSSQAGAVLIFSNCRFINHTNVALTVELTHTQLVIEDSTFSNNALATRGPAGYKGTTLTIVGYKAHNAVLILRNTTFFMNRYGNVLVSPPSTVYIMYINNVTITDCTFVENQGTPVSVYSSTVYLSGHVRFERNTGYKGGGMAFLGSSYLTPLNNSQVDFVENFAQYAGGGMFVQKDYVPFGNWPPCVIQILSFDNCFASFNITLNFTHNNAANGGHAIYGAEFDMCIPNLSGGAPGTELLDPSCGLFYFEPDSDSDLSVLTSDPSRVCICKDEIPDCMVVYADPIPAYPGETFSVSAAVVGQRFGTVSGTVFAQLFHENDSLRPQLGQTLQRSQEVNHTKCATLEYSILSVNPYEVLVLTTNEAVVYSYPTELQVNESIETYYLLGWIPVFLLSFPVYINVTLLPCPWGFMPSDYPSRCVCTKQLQENNITCNLSTQTICTSGSLWVNASFSNGKYDGVIISTGCPYEYCILGEQDTNLEDPDSQCSFGHHGTLCGACKHGLSFTLGNSVCKKCTNRTLFLLAPFAIAGLALVFFIKILNLTVAQGTINGLIFYANIIRAVDTKFFPPQNLDPLGHIFNVFIAWVNLDLGIEVCFFDGLDGYWKTWLQFVFPLYIWGIAIAIIVLSRYSIVAARIAGNNSVAVLSTLFLLSYPKLLRTCITILSYSHLMYPDGHSEAVWLYDGNIKYLEPKHVVLFTAAIFVLIFVWLPYTVILFFGQWLQRHTHRRGLHWVLRLKPFFDAYFGPFKDKHRYWVGLLLLIRGVLFIIFAVYQEYDPSIVLFSIYTTVTLLLAYTHVTNTGSVYKKVALSVLESSFLIHLAILSGIVLYTGPRNTAVVYASVGISFSTFVGIIVYHILVRLGWTRVIEKKFYELFSKKRKPLNAAREGYEHIEPSAANSVEHYTLDLNSAALRESVMDSTFTSRIV